MKGEIWKDIEGYKGLYQVSNKGRVKSLERAVWNSKGYCKTVSERILKPVKTSRGYLQVFLYKEGKRKRPCIHRLVAEAFIPNTENLEQVNHIDEDKTNNCVENLEWCDRLYNMTYNGRAKKVGETNKNNPKLCKPVFSINKESGLIMWWQSAHEAERTLGISNANINACLKGKAKSAGGHIWFYADDNDTE